MNYAYYRVDPTWPRAPAAYTDNVDNRGKIKGARSSDIARLNRMYEVANYWTGIRKERSDDTMGPIPDNWRAPDTYYQLDAASPPMRPHLVPGPPPAAPQEDRHTRPGPPPAAPMAQPAAHDTNVPKAVPVKAVPVKAAPKASPPPLPNHQATYQVDWPLVEKIQTRDNSDPRPLRPHKAPPAGVPAQLCHTAHTPPAIPSHEDQTRIVVNDWEILKTDLTNVWPTYEVDLPHSKLALKKIMLRFHEDRLAEWKQTRHGLTYQAITQHLTKILEVWNRGDPVTIDAAAMARPELGREPFNLTPSRCHWHPPPPRQQPLVAPPQPAPWANMQSTVNTQPQQHPEAEPQTHILRNQNQNQTSASTASSSSTYGTSQDPWKSWQAGSLQSKRPAHLQLATSGTRCTEHYRLQVIYFSARRG